MLISPKLQPVPGAAVRSRRAGWGDAGQARRPWATLGCGRWGEPPGRWQSPEPPAGPGLQESLTTGVSRHSRVQTEARGLEDQIPCENVLCTPNLRPSLKKSHPSRRGRLNGPRPRGPRRRAVRDTAGGTWRQASPSSPVGCHRSPSPRPAGGSSPTRDGAALRWEATRRRGPCCLQCRKCSGKESRLLRGAP